MLQLHGKPERKNSFSAIFSARRETEALKEAEDFGYFKTVNRALIESFSSLRQEAERTPEVEAVEDVRFLMLGGLRIRRLEDLSACRRLTILQLENNFITKIDALASCSQLLKLDLHGNQISQLPGPSFWKGLRRLYILNLHDNPIGKYNSINGLSVCPCLAVLTLFDTPLSIRRRYRHHVVNTVWSLKALDRHVISDEEIIEGATFGGRFVALSSAMQFTMIAPKGGVFEREKEALRSVWQTVSRVNSILAHHSPVLIIQRYWRGYLTRAAIRWAIDTELWAAVTIQRRYREWKCGNWKASVPPPPSTTPIPVERQLPPTPSSAKFDYNAYLMSHRPLSSAFGSSSALSWKRTKPTTSGCEDRGVPGVERTVFDLEKFETQIRWKLEEEDSRFSDAGDMTSKPQSERERQGILSNTFKSKPRKIRSVRVFFGAMVGSETSGETDRHDNTDSPLEKFRLRGVKEDLKSCPSRKELVELNQRSGQSVRLADGINHLTSSLQPKPKVKRIRLAKVREREDRKYQSAIWLACLLAVRKDYRRAEVAEIAAQRADYVRSLKETRDGAKERIRVQLVSQCRRSAVVNQIEEKGFIEDLEERKISRNQTAQKYNDLRHQSAQFEKIRHQETHFATDFIGRTASCTKADFRFGKQEMREQHVRLKKELVREIRGVQANHRDLRQMYKLEQQSSLQNQVLSEKKDLHNKISTSAQQQKQAAKQRVVRIRSQIDTSERKSRTALTLPIVSNPHASRRSHTDTDIINWPEKRNR